MIGVDIDIDKLYQLEHRLMPFVKHPFSISMQLFHFLYLLKIKKSPRQKCPEDCTLIYFILFPSSHGKEW